MTSHFDIEALRIHFTDQGEGEPIVLIHGFMGSVESNWNKWNVFERLSKDHRIIALDCRGHGKSTKPHDPKHYGLEMVWDVVRLLKHLELPKAHIIGYSMGGEIVARLLTMSPEVFLTATIAGASVSPSWDNQKADMEAAEFEQRSVPVSYLERQMGQEPTAVEVRSRSQKWLNDQDHLALAAAMRAMGELVVTNNQMRAVEIPVLGICGADDTRHLGGLDQLRQEMGDRLGNHLQVEKIEGTHLGKHAAPKKAEFVEKIIEFIAAHSSSL